MISSSGSSNPRRVAAEEVGVWYIGTGGEGGEPMILQLTSVYLIEIQFIPLVFVFHLSYQKFCLSYFILSLVVSGGRHRVVGIATRNGLDCPGFRTPGGG